jgi:cyclopropane fatty-acyl-phospholipid synthase-like methyltransferase
MEDCEWMYTGRVGRNDVTPEWITKTDAFLEQGFGEGAKVAHLVPCPCSKCANRKRKTKKVIEYIWKNGFTPDHTRWIFHGEAHRTREEVVRQHVEDYDSYAGVADMLNDYHEAQFSEERTEDEPEATTKAFYYMFDAAPKPLHDNTKVSQLDDIGRITV